MFHISLILKEGRIIIGILALVSLVILISPWSTWAIIPFIITIFCIYFFRNPIRHIVDDDEYILCPADGRIVKIEQVYEDRYLHALVNKVTIFLSLFDVHVNRLPVSGTVEWVEKVGGLYLPAFSGKAPSRNSRNFVGIKSDDYRVLVVQITGIIARRIICQVGPGDAVKAGDIFGMICFGSCTELYLPVEVDLRITPGQKVRGGETIIGEVDKAKIG